MKELIDGVKDKFAANSTLNTAFGSLWFDMAPEKTALPYARMHIITSVPDHMFGSKYIENTIVQISMFGTSHATLLGHLDTLNSVFDRATLTLDSGTHIDVNRTLNLPVQQESGVYKDGNKVYHVGSQFRCRVDRSY